MRIEVHGSIHDELADAVWRLYNEAFEELRSSAVQRHLMNRDEFDEVVRDPRVLKYIAVDPEQGDRLCAMSTLTNRLDAIPLISPEYFQRRWPAHFAAGRIWYIGFLGIRPDCRSTGVFEQLVEAMYEARRTGPVLVAFDVSRRNERYGFPQAIREALERHAGPMETHRLDEQTYWAFEAPEPMAA
jgi:ribosomal protein S18 acetylase RimI-like enzyme